MSLRKLAIPEINFVSLSKSMDIPSIVSCLFTRRSSTFLANARPESCLLSVVPTGCVEEIHLTHHCNDIQPTFSLLISYDSTLSYSCLFDIIVRRKRKIGRPRGLDHWSSYPICQCILLRRQSGAIIMNKRYSGTWLPVIYNKNRPNCVTSKNCYTIR